MPGIVGFITKQPRAWAEPQLQRMLATMRHEPFYRMGTWVDEANGVYVGWTAIEKSFSDSMPLLNERGDVCLIFSGEEYSDPDIAQRLRDSGHSFDGGGPAYLVHQYEEDSAFPANLNGRFHGVLTDQNRRKVLLFNDRFGMGRIYYHQSNGDFYFAGEAKAILAVRPQLKKVDARAIGEFISCGCVLGNRTLFEGVEVLPPGSAWMLQRGEPPKKNCYFRPDEWEKQTPLEPERYYRQIKETFSRNLPRYFQGRERIGIALTGGLDTRAILAWWKAAPNSLPCYTFGSSYHENQDVIVARQVAQACQQNHEVICVGEDFLSQFASYAERSIYITDGCVDMTRVPDLYVSERARTIAPCKVVGTFGSEVLQQMTMFRPVQADAEVFHRDIIALTSEGEQTYYGHRQQNPVSFAVFAQFPWYHYGVFALEQSQLTVRSPYLDNEFVKGVYQAPKLAAQDTDIRQRLIADGSRELARIRSDRGIGGRSNSLKRRISNAYLEFTFKAEYAYDYGMPQWVARTDHWLRAFHLERMFLGRHKVFHFRVWYRDALANYVREMLLDPRTLARPYLQRRGVEKVVDGHLRGNENHTNEIHQLLALELIHRLFIDS
jgi:asparagine synthase (glutamine-hydrolysing)